MIKRISMLCLVCFVVCGCGDKKSGPNPIEDAAAKKAKSIETQMKDRLEVKDNPPPQQDK